MSYSVDFVGTVEEVQKQVESHQCGFPEGQAEYDAAKPHLLGLLALNTPSEYNNIHVQASGHANRPTVGPRQSTCFAKIEWVARG